MTFSLGKFSKSDSVPSGLEDSEGFLSAESLIAITRVDAEREALGVARDEIVDRAREIENDIIAAAHVKAREILEQASEAFDLASQQGYADGKAKAFSDWLTWHSQSSARLHHAETKCRERLINSLSRAVDDLASFIGVETIYNRIVDHFEHGNREVNSLNVYCPPDDFPVASSTFERFADRWTKRGSSIQVNCMVDHSLSAGSCRAESDLGVVEIGLNQWRNTVQLQLDQLKVQLVDGKAP